MKGTPPQGRNRARTTAPSRSPSDDGERVEAVERALLLLQCFDKVGEELTLAVLAQRSGLYKSTILRLAASLVRMKFLRRDPAGRFGLGPELRRLGMLSSAKVSLEPLVRPVLEELAAKTQETASFYVRDGNERICLYRVNSPRSARHHLDEGARHPLGTGATGLILSAYDPLAEDDPEAARIRTRGWVKSDGGRDPDLAAVAVALVNREGDLLGALSVSGLRSRFKATQFSAIQKLLTGAAATLQPQLPARALIDLGRDG